MYVDPQQACWLRAGEGAFGLLYVHADSKPRRRVGLTWRVVRWSKRTPRLFSRSVTASVTVERGKPRRLPAR